MNTPAYIIEALCIHETFRKLGFSPDDIYFVIHGIRKPFTVSILLRSQSKEFVVNIEQTIAKSKKELLREWHDGVELWNSGALGQETWEKSNISKNRTRLLVAMKTKGFEFKKNFN